MAWGDPLRPIRFALVGAATGIAAATLNFVPIGWAPGLAIGGHCFGIGRTAGFACGGIDAALYLFPGAVFGLVFGVLLRLRQNLTTIGAGLYAIAATVANGVAVFVCVGLASRLDPLMLFDSTDLAVALSGLVAGGVGGGLLSAALAVLNPRVRRALPIAAAAGLGLLTPLVPRFGPIGDFAFYMLWQGGYAAALARSLSPTGRARTRILVAMTVLRWLRARPAIFALCGVATGAVTAVVCTVAKFGEVEPFAISGYCLGVQASGAGVMQAGACSGIDGAFYLLPGLVFGIVFGPLLHCRRHLSRSGAIGYVLAAVMANAVAVTVCVSALHPLNDLLSFDNPVLDLAVAGIIAGAAGGALLGMIFRAFHRGASIRPGIVVAGALGMLAPLIIMFDAPGGFAFYMIWQGGYAAAVAAGLQDDG